MEKIEKNQRTWEEHYKRQKSQLGYPDENLVRLLSGLELSDKKAWDFGSGSGRHCKLLLDFGFQVFASDIARNAKTRLSDLSLPITWIPQESFQLHYTPQFFQVVVAWGVLHYNSREDAKSIVNQLYDSLVPGGFFLGSIRAETDTHLALSQGSIGLKDLEGGYAITYSLPELQDLLSPFSQIQIGYSERTPLGELDKRICHYFFKAKK